MIPIIFFLEIKEAALIVNFCSKSEKCMPDSSLLCRFVFVASYWKLMHFRIVLKQHFMFHKRMPIIWLTFAKLLGIYALLCACYEGV